MELKLFRHLWGVTLPWEEAFPLVKKEGFVGIEAPLPPAHDAGRFRDLLQRNEFDYIPMAFTEGKSVAEHVRSLRKQIDAAEAIGVYRITIHSGQDAFSPAEASAFFTEAIAIQKSVGVQMGHETHRGRILYNPWTTRDMLDRFPDLKLVCDYSHWVCVAERLLGDCEAILRQCADHCVHLHARVGYEEGPQVPDPSAPEYRAHLEAHERWWKMIWDVQRQKNQPTTTATPEFGPPNYLHTLPHSNVPVADLWKVCNWMATRTRATFDS